MTRASNAKIPAGAKPTGKQNQIQKCPYCGSKKVIKSGKRKTRRKISQRYQCTACLRTFSIQSLKRVSYPPKVILTAISLYNQGYTLKETRAKIRTRFKMDPKEPTIHLWPARYKNICTFYNLRKKYQIDPKDIIFSKKFYHQQVYEFKYHKLKLNIIGKQYPTLKSYLLSLTSKGIDNRLFKEGLRCSDFPLELNIKGQSLKKIPTNNATKIARFGLELANTNRERHQAIENFFLINDSATIAIEIPVFLTPKEARTLGIPIPKTLTGHIDLLQVRSNRIHILDYKPDAKNDKLAREQLTLYALALGKRTNIPPKKMTCAYFDENAYFQFTPNK
jgi:predicted RNA-binding Zn-ribbon protein involved in translation (DUF1610 family)